jgi:hypothetical protein
VAPWGAEPEEHELDLLAAAVAAPVLQAACSGLRIDRMPDPDADHGRPEVPDLALAATEKRHQLRRHRRVVEFEANHPYPHIEV